MTQPGLQHAGFLRLVLFGSHGMAPKTKRGERRQMVRSQLSQTVQESFRPLQAGKTTSDPAALLQAIFASSEDAIIAEDLEHFITHWNTAAKRVFGYPQEETLGRPASILIPADRRRERDEILDRALGGERVEHFETARLRRDGTLINVTESIAPICLADGKIVGVLVLARGIGAAKTVSDESLLLAAIVDSSEDAVVSKDLDGTITSWNAAAERIFGYKVEEIVGRSVLTLIPHDRKDEEAKILDRLRRGERLDHFETVRVRKNGEHFPVSLTISPVKNTRGEIVGASKIARDITEYKNAAAERETLLRSEQVARGQAEYANRMKDEFLATVSHELRTPLNAIVGWTEVLADGGQDQEELAHGIDVIKKNAMVQAQLIEDLLDLSRITSGKMLLHIKPIDLSIIISEAIASVQHAANARQITLQSAPYPIQGELLGDPRRLQQIIWNLLANAIKFSHPGGHVAVTAAQAGATIEIAVTDNGRGIAPHFLPHLFEWFRQADASTAREHGGLGIGLALVKRLVELHGGEVRALSNGLGQGATFVVRLPVSGPRQGKPAAIQPSTKVIKPSGSDLSHVKVLAVDDDPDSLEIIVRILAAQRAEARTAASAAEAMEVLRTFSPDIIISDIAMPREDGYTLIRRLRGSPAFSGIPAVALTSFARAEDRSQALEAGFQIHVAKPVMAAELIGVVRTLTKMQATAEPGQQRSQVTEPRRDRATATGGAA